MLSPAVRTMLNQKRKTKRGKRDRLKKEQQFRKKRGTKQYPVHDNMEDTIKMFQEEVIKVNGIQSHQIQGYYYHKDGTKIGEGIAGSVYDCALPKAEGGGAYAVKVMSYAINELLHEKLEEFTVRVSATDIFPELSSKILFNVEICPFPEIPKSSPVELLKVAF